MKIGFLGNANNYPFMLALALRRAGHEVHFIVDRKSPLDRPENRYSDMGPPYPDWIEDASDLPEAWSFHRRSAALDRVIGTLQDCDAVVLNQAGPALAPWIDRPHIALLTGADLQFLANRTYLENAAGYRLSEQAVLKYLVAAQREGIRSALAVSYFHPGLMPSGDALLAEIGVEDERRLFWHMSDAEYIRAAPPPNNKVLRIFCPARICWIRKSIDPVTEDYKGSDIMLRGLALFVRKTGASLDIRLPEKGKDVGPARELVRELGLDSMVHWFAPMSQATVLEEYARADIIFDQLGKSIVGMSGMDALAVGRPVIANGRPEIFKRFVEQPPAVLQASTPEEVSAQLMAMANPEARLAAGEHARNFIVAHGSADQAAKMCASIFGRVLGHPPALELWRADCEAGRTELLNQHAERLSELSETLSRRELEVHERETTFEGRMEMLRERENGVLRVEGDLAQRMEMLRERENGVLRVEGDLAQRAELSTKREEAIARRESTLADEEAYYRGLPLFKQTIQFRAWLRRRRG